MIQAKTHYDPGLDLNFITDMVRPGMGPCISIIVGLHTALHERRQNTTLIQRAVREAHDKLNSYWCPHEMRLKVRDKIEALVTTLDNHQSGQSVGLFVSPEIASIVSFPFSVNEMVLVGESFETRDILYLKQYLNPYYIVSLSKDAVRLFTARADSMHEIREWGFPCSSKDDYEYARSTRASSVGYGMKGFEKDKGILSDIRSKSFVKDAARQLSTHLGGSETELIVCGPSRLVNDFAEACTTKELKLVKVRKTHTASDFAVLVKHAWEACQAKRKQKLQELIDKLENTPLNYKAIGIRDVWVAATNGKGLLLLVERDYLRRAYVPLGATQIRLHPPKEEFEPIADAVDDVIEKVLMAGGKVVFTEANQLRKFEQVVLMLRHK